MRHAIAVLLCLSLFSAFLADAHIHAAHAGHDHHAHSISGHALDCDADNTDLDNENKLSDALDHEGDEHPATGDHDQGHCCHPLVGDWRSLAELSVPTLSTNWFARINDQTRASLMGTLDRPPKQIL